LLTTDVRLPEKTVIWRPCGPKSLLITDDDESFRWLVSRLLRGEGYELREAETGEHAIREMLLNPAQVLVTDIVMPDQDGLETIRKAHRLFPNLKIIAMSGVVRGQEYLELALAFGAKAAVHKHLVAEQLPRIVRGMSSP
jgi:CheY-like chemotaxis protein